MKTLILLILLALAAAWIYAAPQPKYEIARECSPDMTDCVCKEGTIGCGQCNQCRCDRGRWVCTELGCPSIAEKECWHMVERVRSWPVCRPVSCSQKNIDEQIQVAFAINMDK